MRAGSTSLFAFLLAATFGAGCGRSSLREAILTGPARAPYAGPVTVAFADAPLPPQYVEVALLQVAEGQYEAPEQQAVDKLKLEAARLGCDAVVRVRVELGDLWVVARGVAVRTPAVR